MLSRKKISDGVKKAHALSWIDLAIGCIQRESGDYNDWYSPLRIDAFMHKVMLSGMWVDIQGDYYKLWTVFEGLHIDDHFVPSERMPSYKERWIKHSPGFQMYVYVYPIGYRPPYRIEIIPRERASIGDWKDLLKKLRLWFPKLKVSTVDYAIDEYCYSPRTAENLFLIQSRHLYIPYQEKVEIYGEDLIEFGNQTRLNAVYRSGNVKMYERGPDKKKNGKGWSMEDVDRVRLEYSAPREVLRDHGITFIADLIRNPLFHEINKNTYKFKRFKGSKKLPMLGQDYTTPVKNGNIGFFQSEDIGHRKNINNIAHYRKDIKEFGDLKSALRDAMQRFDLEWVGA